MGSGIAGLQGPLYSGTGCFHRRKVIYGSWPDGRMEIKGRNGMQSTFPRSFFTLFMYHFNFLSGILKCAMKLSITVFSTFW